MIDPKHREALRTGALRAYKPSRFPIQRELKATFYFIITSIILHGESASSAWGLFGHYDHFTAERLNGLPSMVIFISPSIIETSASNGAVCSLSFHPCRNRKGSPCPSAC